MNHVKISTSSSGNTELIAAVTGRKIRVISYVIVCNAAVNVKFQSGSTDITGLLYFAANGGAACTVEGLGCFQTAAGEALNINLSGAIAVGGHITYVVVD